MAVLVRSYGDARAKEVFDEMVHIEEEEKQKAEELKSRALQASPFFSASISIPLFWRCSFWRLRRLRALIPC